MEKAPRRKQAVPAKKVPRADGTCSFVRYSPEIAAEICERLARGEIWFRICNTGRMPSYDTLYRWRERYPDFAEALTRAREMAADYKADMALAVAQAATPATVQADRLHVNTLQWHAAKHAPHRYGAKAEEAPKGGKRLVIEVRKFEEAVGADGARYLREIPRKARRA